MIVEELIAKLSTDESGMMRGITSTIEGWRKWDKKIEESSRLVQSEMDKAERVIGSFGLKVERTMKTGNEAFDKLIGKMRETASESQKVGFERMAESASKSVTGVNASFDDLMEKQRRVKAVLGQTAENIAEDQRKASAASVESADKTVAANGRVKETLTSMSSKFDSWAHNVIANNEKAAEAAKRGGRAAEESASMWDRLTGGALKVAVGIGAYNLFSQAVEGVKSAFIDFNQQVEQTQIGMTTMLRSTKAANAEMKWMFDFAAKTPFRFGGLVQAEQQMLAMGISIKQIHPAVKAIGDTVAALGGSMEDMGRRVVHALGQIQAGGKVNAREIMELAYAGIPAWKYLAKAIGTDVPTAMEINKKSAISSSIAIKAILGGMEEDFGGMMEAQSHTLIGAWSTVLDYLQINVSKATMPVYKAVKQGVLDLANFMGSPAASHGADVAVKHFQDAAKFLGDTFGEPIMKIVDGFEHHLLPAAVRVASNLKPTFELGGAAALIFLKVVERTVDVLGALADLMGQNKVVADGLAIAIGTVVAAMEIKKVTDWFGAISQGTAVGAGGVQGFIGKIVQMGTVTSYTFNDVGEEIKKTGWSAKQFGASLGESLGGIATMGAAGLAVAAVAGIGYALEKSAQRAAELKREFQSMRDAIISAEGDLTNKELQLSILGDVKDKGKLVQYMTEMRTNLADLIPIIESGARMDKAADGWRKAFKGLNAGLIGGGGVKLVGVLGTIDDAITKLGDPTKVNAATAAIYKYVGGADKLHMSLGQFRADPLTKMFIEQAKSGRLTAAAALDESANIRDLTDSFLKSYPAGLKLLEAQNKVNAGAEDGTLKAKKAAEGWHALSSAYTAPVKTGKALEEQQKAIDKALEATQKVLDSTMGYFDKWSDAETTWADSVRTSLQGAADPFTSYKKKTEVSLSQFRYNLYKSMGDAQTFATNLQKLMKMGLDPEVFDYLIKQGPGQVGDVIASLAKSPNQLAGFQDQIKKFLHMDDAIKGLQDNAKTGEQALADMEKNMAENILKTAAWVKDMQTLLARGLDPDAYDQLFSAGASKGLPIVEALLKQGQAGIDKMNALAQAKVGVEMGSKQLNVDRQFIPEINAGNLQGVFTELQKKIGNVGPDTFWGAIAAMPPDTIAKVKGMVATGVKSMYVWLHDQANKDPNRVILPVKFDTKAVQQQIAGKLAGVMNAYPSLAIHSTLDPKGATKDLEKFLLDVEKAPPAKARVDGNTKQATDAARSFWKYVEQTTGITTLGADPTLARAVLKSVLGDVDTSTGSVALSADPIDAYKQYKSFIEYVEQHPVKTAVQLNIQDAVDRLNFIAGLLQHEAATPAGQSGGWGGRVTANLFANGTEDHRAHIAPGTHLRVWAEPETGGEAYIPLAQHKRPRSMEILNKVAQKFGAVVHKYGGGGEFGGNLNKPSAYTAPYVPPTTRNDLYESLKAVDALAHRSASIRAFFEMMRGQTEATYRWMEAYAMKHGGMRGGGGEAGGVGKGSVDIHSGKGSDNSFDRGAAINTTVAVLGSTAVQTAVANLANGMTTGKGRESASTIAALKAQQETNDWLKKVLEGITALVKMEPATLAFFEMMKGQSKPVYDYMAKTSLDAQIAKGGKGGESIAGLNKGGTAFYSKDPKIAALQRMHNDVLEGKPEAALWKALAGGNTGDPAHPKYDPALYMPHPRRTGGSALPTLNRAYEESPAAQAAKQQIINMYNPTLHFPHADAKETVDKMFEETMAQVR